MSVDPQSARSTAGRPAPAGTSGDLVRTLVRIGGEDGVGWAQAVLDALRSLLGVQSAEEASGVLTAFVRALGGEVVPTRVGRADALSVDLSLGAGDPLVACAPDRSPSRLALEAAIPALVDDAARVVTARRGGASVEALVDPTTGLHRRRELVRLLPRLAAGDVLLLIQVRGVDASSGADTLRSLARTVRGALRLDDVAFAYEEAVVLVALRRLPPTHVRALAERLRDAWRAVSPAAAELAMAAAVIGDGDPRSALGAAEAALEGELSAPVLLVLDPP